MKVVICYVGQILVINTIPHVMCDMFYVYVDIDIPELLILGGKDKN